MTPARPAVYYLTVTAMLLFSLPSYAQRKRTVDTLLRSRWELTFNPFGLLEPKAAVGLGVGFAFNRHWELWSETSRLQHIFLNPESSSGIRQILQLKYFIHGLPDNFLAAEVRYKGYQYTGFHPNAKDIDLGDTAETIGLYYPGSIRLIWAFGKKL